MSGDHIKRFNLSERSPRVPFAKSAVERPPIRDKDNAQPVIPPPRANPIAHPRLAPPGMMGAVGARLLNDSQKALDKAQKDQTVEKAAAKVFEPIIRAVDKTRTPER